jgi:PAS domain S-box-containing protein
MVNSNAMSEKRKTAKKPKRKILVVDDDPHIILLLKEKLGARGRSILGARSGLEGVKCALRERPDLILLDVMMPRMDGHQVCRFVKSVAALRRTKILLLTVKQGVGDRQRGLLEGADDYLTKPFDLEELEGKVEALMASSGREGRSRPPEVPGEELPSPEEITDELVVSMLNQNLDESVHRFALLEKISKNLMAAVDREEILTTMLAGAISPVGLGWERVLLMVADETAGALRAEKAFALTQEPGEGRLQWAGLLRTTGSHTMEELLRERGKFFCFQTPGKDAWLRTLQMEMDPAALRSPEGDTASVIESFAAACGKADLDSFLSRIFWNKEVTAVPIVGRELIFGLVAADRFFSHRSPRVEDVDHLWFLCHQTGLALERDLLHREAQKRAEEYGRLSLLNESILDSVDLGVVFIDENHGIRSWNKAMTHFTGLKDSQVLGKDFFALFPALKGTIVHRRFEQARTGGSFQRVGHFSHSLKKVREGIFDIRLAAVRRRRQVLGTVMIWENVQVRIRLERKAREAHRYLTNLIEHSGDAIITLDGKGRIRTWNQGASEIFGYPEEETVGRSLAFLFVKGNKRAGSRLVRETFQKGKVANLLETMVHREGEPLQVSITTSVVENPGSSKMDVAAIIRDVSERMRMESQLFQTEKLASLGIMAAGMAHEINNPLTSIMMYSQILGMNETLGEEDRGCVSKIEEDAGRIADIVNSLLVFSRPSSRQTEEVDVMETVEKAITFVRYRTGKKRFKIQCSYGDDLPRLSGVTTEVQEIFLNLLINARDALEDGGHIEVSVCHHPPGTSPPQGFSGDAPQGIVEIAVRDNGSGILGEHLQKIYDPFFTTKPPGRGTGLGLAVVRRLVENHGGCITVRSKPGEGTLFQVYLPPGGGVADGS